jgi:hypothetical protein
VTGARARIEAWIAATRRATRPHAPALVEAIAAESGLSPPGVILALEEILEVDRAPAELDRFLAHPRLSAVGERASAAVVLSSTVPTAGFRAIAWALAQSPRVVVRPSRRCRALVSAIAETAPGIVALAPSSDRPEDDLHALVAGLGSNGALHVYGGDGALATAKEATKQRADLHVELHGPGFGVIVAGDRDIEERARAIATDVAAFDQRGCLSPRLALVVGDVSRAADALHAALSALDVQVPRGSLDDHERAEVRLARETARFAGRLLEGAGHAVYELPASSATPVGPVGRNLPFIGVRGIEEAVDRLRPFSGRLTHVGTVEGWREALATLAPTCPLGAMQRPPFDGPVDKRI